MSRHTLTRSFSTDLEVRGADGRTIVGIAVPFDVPAWIDTLHAHEVFRMGAFARTIAERADRVKLLAQHDTRSLPLGRATLLREDPAGLYLEGRVSRTTAGDEALELIRDGALDSFSIGFSPIAENWSRSGDLVERTEVALREVSVVAFPAYEGAAITAVRSADLQRWRHRLGLDTEHPPTDPTLWRHRFAALTPKD